ncbi:hypothetical protein BO70DRAFT_356553 [Aspergillus heteromorphus CBS 117.55]|uniref:BRCT domain-containing protein n=1 Tax=Aspergillus heteromorphus CBS 117.55 TaxID=1448321 RepID=A0A317UX14_9EURO|nr:uncharacterized protein BO70DRAFT_356553 [Aspergillus heteromorphus CBS 117.55]PWY66066.1 hypothetical protein BO70DRAFT_356553 [Aspergillus heteromorphus CBS 117.55]
MPIRAGPSAMPVSDALLSVPESGRRKRYWNLSIRNKEHPLAGVVLCFTSILPEERSELALVAGQMGATHKYDLTSDVTHLLIGEVNTPKYKFVAKERPDVIVVRPEWVEAVRQSWMQGGDTDIRALEDEYRYPTFAGLSICITGFEDMTLRNHIESTVTAHGGEFRKDLTKNASHLVAKNTEGEKYKFATQWGIKVVTVKWFTDTLERGMVLEETLYHPLLPEENQGVGAWSRALPAPKPKAPEAENPSNPRPRKLRRIASVKLEDQNKGIWGDIVGTGFESSSEPKPAREGLRRSESLQKSASILQASRSFASETTFAEAQEPRPPAAEPVEEHRNGFLDGCFFFIHGFSSKQTTVLRDHLSFNGAQMVGSLSEFSRPDIPKRGHGLYTIVPHKMPRTQVPSTDDLAFECEVVTDMWLERCLDAKKLVPPESHIANTPIPSFPIKGNQTPRLPILYHGRYITTAGFAGMKVCSTGFSRIDLLHLLKLVNLIGTHTTSNHLLYLTPLGATYNEYLTPTASVLICNPSVPTNADKLRHTQEWGVPAVSADWLWACIRTEQKQSFDNYLVQKPPTQSRKSLEARAGSRPEQPQPQPQPQPQQQPQKNNENSTTSHDISPAKASARNTPTRQKSTDPKTGLASPSISQNTPSKQNQKQAFKPSSPASITSPLKRKSSPQRTTTTTAPATTTATTQSALNLTVTNLLKHARPDTSNTNPNPNPNPAATATATGSTERIRPRGRIRKPLLGRAPSTTSTTTSLSQNQPSNPNAPIPQPQPQPQPQLKGLSRASSIDTLNEDGTGSIIGIDSTDGTGTGPTLPRANSNISNYVPPPSPPHMAKPITTLSEEEESGDPPMTQLDYEDPDAVAMREKFLHQAGKVVAKKHPGDGEGDGAGGRKKQRLVPGGLEADILGAGGVGVGAARRTRNAVRVSEEY